ncbi:MAG: TonB-dependent receptor [Fidelibacterota bacterium]
MKKLMVSLIASVFSLTTAQNTIVTGLVTDRENGSILMGANVLISSDNLTTGAATDFDGRFTIPDIPPGIYRLKATYIGYKNFEQTISITGEQVRFEYNIQLAVSAIQLQEYVVTASRGKREKITDAPAAVSIISELKIRNASNPNLGDYFKNIKGVDFTSSGLDSYNLSARGFNSSFSSRLLTLTDGRMANVPSLRLIAYNTIPLTSDDVKQIEVVLGPSSALYGPNAHSGVVNIISKRPFESKGTVAGYTIGTREFNKFQARHAGTMGKLGYKLSFVNFTAYDWESVEEEEKKPHLKPWVEKGGSYGEELDKLFDDGQATWDGWNIKIDNDDDGKVDTVLLKKDNIIPDRDGDGLPDVPDFNIKNRRFDLRMDYNFSPEHFVSLNFGQALATNINITGVGRYLAQDWNYRFYQLRWVYNNWFAQAYLNTSNSGNTVNMRTGQHVIDHSKFFHFQFQHHIEFPRFLNSTFVWGGDYQRTMPETFGTILPDGTGGRNPVSFGNDKKDNDGDGKIDEWDELIVTNEYGVYAQLQSELTDHIEFILSGRLDLHSAQLDSNGFRFLADPLGGGTFKYFPQWSPKVGLLWKPDDNQTFRLTAARAFNTPSSQGLYLDLLAAIYNVFPVEARGNKDGYTYLRNKSGSLMMYDVRGGSYSEFRLTDIPENGVLYIPEVLGRKGRFVNPVDYTKIDPVKSEVVWTYEFGYAGLIGERVRVTMDLYYSTYSDFVSDLTWVTPVVLDTSSGFYSVDDPDPDVLGFLPLAEHSGIKDGGDGVFGAYWIDYNTPEYWSTIPDGWWDRPIDARKGTDVVIVNGDTLGAWWSDDKVDFTNPIELVLTNINYGRISLWGMDASIYAFLTERITADVNFSYLGRTRFWNFLTRSYDPINAPQFKINATLAYNVEHGLFGNIGFRYIPQFDWSAGVHFGTIPTYFIIDTMIGYKISQRYSLLLNIKNLNGDNHREIVGGPKLGRHITIKFTTNF